MRPLFIIAGIVGLIAAVSMVGCAGQIDQGTEGVRVSYGKVVTTSMEPGLYLSYPGSEVFEFTNRAVTVTDQTQTYTSDLQPADINYTYQYHLNRGNAGSIYKAIGSDWEQRLVKNFVNDSLKNVVGKYEAVALVQNRQEVGPKTREMLQATMNLNAKNLGLPEGLVTVDSFVLNNTAFSGQFQDAVESKVTAVQRAEQAQNETVRVKEEADQRVIAAKADAEAMRIKSDALSQNQNLIEYERVQVEKVAAEKWNGALPYYVTAGAPMPLLNLNK